MLVGSMAVALTLSFIRRQSTTGEKWTDQRGIIERLHSRQIMLLGISSLFSHNSLFNDQGGDN